MVESQGPTVITISAVFAVITAVVICLRLWARVFLVQQVGPDDVLISIAALLSWAFIAVTIESVHHGLGSHYEDVAKRGMDNLISYTQIVWLSSLFYNACLGFIKTSVLALYMRLGDRKLRRLSFIMIGLVTCQASGNVLAALFQCSPVSAAYNLRITEKKCIDINAFYLANAAVNIFTDLLTYTLPIKLVMRLQVPRNQKIGLGVMLCLGLFACISSIVRITFIPQMLVSTDPTWVISGAMYWSVIETNVGILAASIPSFKVIVKRYAPRLMGSYYESNRYASGPKHGGGSSHASRNAFRKMESQTGTVNLRSMDRTDAAHGFKDMKDSGVRTRVEQDAASNSSEEALNLPDGRIGVRTQIVTQFEGGASSTPHSQHSDFGSLYETLGEAKLVQGQAGRI